MTYFYTNTLNEYIYQKGKSHFQEIFIKLKSYATLALRLYVFEMYKR
jgi:hypothetical protein